jgi:hypothetical protein
MKDFNLNDLLKYVVTGGWIYFLLSREKVFGTFESKDSELLILFICFSLGAVTYYVFRTLLFPTYQRQVVDRILKKMSGRNYLREKHKIGSWATQNDLWVMFHVKHKGQLYGNYHGWLFSFLMLYTLGFTTLIFSISFYSFCEKELYIFLLICLILMLSATRSNLNYEKRLFNNVAIIDKETFDQFVEKFLKSGHNNETPKS